MNNDYPFINREISTLNFNQRVLYEAKDKDVPLFERLKFVAIFSSNCDEFYMIRVAGLKDQVEAGYDKKDRSGLTPKEQLEKISLLAHKLVVEQQNIFRFLVEECSMKNVIFSPKLEGDLYDIAESIFHDEILAVISPVTLSPANPFPFIYNNRLTIFVEMEREGKHYEALVIIPENLRRIYQINLNGYNYIMTIEQIIKQFLDEIFLGFEIRDSYMFRLTRNADLTVTEEGAEDLLKLIESQLSKRKKGNVVRVEVDQEMPDKVRNFLMKNISFEKDDIFVVDGIIDLTFLFNIKSNKGSFYYKPFLPKLPKDIPLDSSLFDRIKEKDIILYRPYNDFRLIARLVELAANDKDVLAIKMTLYRANRDSSIISSLISAAGKGKQVSIVIELKARFDEEKNVEWAKKMEEAGCVVTYGIMGLKIHAKNLLIVRKEQGKIVRYSHIATGNYNENTARLYTDIDYLTSDEDVGRETGQLFNLLTGYTDFIPDKQRLSLAPADLRNTILSLIDNEIKNASNKIKGKIIIKINSLIDKKLIVKLYEASQAGVKIDMIVRGICGSTPGIKGLSDNIKVRSIVGRFLEHPRILYFYNGGNERFFISTADWMERNMDHRVESLFEIVEKTSKDKLRKLLEYNLRDNCKTWELVGTSYNKVKTKGKRFNQQEYLMDNSF